LLHVIGRIERVDEGEVLVGDANVAGLLRSALAAYRRTVGLVFQRFSLMPALTKLDNVLLPLLPSEPLLP
jgi:putative ABC transport system ATP-binding protein